MRVRTHGQQKRTASSERASARSDGLLPLHIGEVESVTSWVALLTLLYHALADGLDWPGCLALRRRCNKAVYVTRLDPWLTFAGYQLRGTSPWYLVLFS
ncbi:hypothetical protein NDU88_001312 [Pleurodeles waltl]|uniref:Uncharacterized protein n=1 Tax=Pleurodeles waltl TaxID=8319 RepID=A0AAV7P7J9_PLEWA|nr:hypothetical protein NDU88_001312 [Pleurodeles waltl]